MEAVHELEAERDQEGDAEEDEGADGQRRFADGVHVTDEAEDRVAEAGDQNEKEDDDSGWMRAMIQARTAFALRVLGRQWRWCCNCVRHDSLHPLGKTGDAYKGQISVP
ncbi:hypothetical protein GCM10007884_41470 [Methylobacterium brachythecii]|uniref:Uncharacterized protein n=1 Tax=Methylobacterium brachythecii TaxID=1176177 RepID=A0ABQ6D806_9HYPH|nr:hypothetical protein GCM10007884_41470 [Methylobacterium brachythecii]